MRRDISSISKMCAELQIKGGHEYWAKHRQTDELINLEKVLMSIEVLTGTMLPVRGHQPAPPYLIEKRRGRCRAAPSFPFCVKATHNRPRCEY